MRGSRRMHMPGVGDEFVAERLIVNVDAPEPPMQRLAYKNVVEHLATAVMQDAPPAVRRKGSIEHDKRAFGQQRITGVLLSADNEVDRNFVVLSVEIAGNGNERRWIVIKKLLKQKPQLERLTGATHSRQEITLRPAAHRLPNEGLELLASDGRSKRRAQVHIDDAHGVGVRRLDLRKQDWSVESDGFGLGFHGTGCSWPV